MQSFLSFSPIAPSCTSLYSNLVAHRGNARDGARPDEELKAVMALCTLLNARSARTKGLQLMVSLMLVARATGRQVYRYIHLYNTLCIPVQACCIYTCMCLNSGYDSAESCRSMHELDYNAT